MEVDMSDRNWHLLEEAILKTRTILNAPVVRHVFTADEYMKYYTCVYDICTHNHTRQAARLYGRYKKALEESIQSVVLPIMKDKHDDSLLVGLLEMWGKYKMMARVLIRIFHYIDNENFFSSLDSVATGCFCDLVCSTFFSLFQHIVISMINQGRRGKQMDWNLIKNVLVFFSEIDKKENMYSKKFELVILSDAASYVTQLASEWFSSETHSSCLSKAALAFSQEEILASQFLNGATLAHYLQVVYQTMKASLEKKAMEEQEAEIPAKLSIQELLFKCSAMSISDQPAPHLPQ